MQINYIQKYNINLVLCCKRQGKFNAVMLDGHLEAVKVSQLPFKDLNRTEILDYNYFWYPVKGNKDW